jgi:hypothetical protein
MQKSRLLGAVCACLALVSFNARVALSASTANQVVTSAHVDAAGQQVEVRGSFSSTSLAVLFDGALLNCSSISTTSITCDLPNGLTPGTYRLEVQYSTSDETVVTTTGKERPVQFKSSIDLTLPRAIAITSNSNVRDYGAKGDGVTDDTQAINDAIAATQKGGVIYFPPGNYLISSELAVNKPLRIKGDGFGSQIHQSTNGSDIFHISNVNAAILENLYLGSISSTMGSSLIKLTNSHHNRIDNIIMLGSYYGVMLEGSLLNTLVDLKSGINFQGFFAPVSTNQYWVYLERFNNISPNANTFIAPVLEGGTNGIWMNETAGQGNMTILGGTIEGVSGTGIRISNTFLPIVMSGMHFEVNGISDVLIDGGKNIKIESAFGDGNITVTGFSRNVHISNSVIDIINIGADAVGTQLTNITYKITAAGTINNLADDTMFTNVANNAAGHVNWFNTIGVGVTNPNANPVGLTPNRKLHVKGKIFEEPAP